MKPVLVGVGLENQEKKSGYVLLRVEFDGSLRDGTTTTTTTKKGKEKIVKMTRRCPYTRNWNSCFPVGIFEKKKELGVQSHSQLRKFYEHGKHFK